MDEIILNELHELRKLINEQNLLRKEVLNFAETCNYLDVSESHLYKLTSRKQIPHFCPQGKKLYFNRHELETWLQQNRQISTDEIEQQATDYLLKNKRR
ncbi:MAG: helix-turn-helix domain-containing protein [Bacteroidales bacterium]